MFIVSYPRSGSTLLRKYFSLLQGRPQRSVYDDDIVYEPGEALTRALDGIDLVKSHQWPGGHEDIVYLVRDGRNATLSFLYMKFLIGNHQFSALHDVHDALRYIDADEGSWADHVKAALSHGNGRRIVFLKYEDLILRPVWSLQCVLDFMQVSLPSTVLDQCVRLERQSSTYANNPKNGYLFRPQAGSIYDLIKRHRIEDYWRFVFNAPARRYFHENGATEFLLRFGYEQSADWWTQTEAPNVPMR
ncbi:MAG: sulfotransferase domain-containing protein [Rudaea sp.]